MSGRPARVLHVLGSLDRGGAETWAIQLLGLLDRSRVEVDLLVHRAGGAYEDAARSAGARVFCLSNRATPRRYMREVGRLLEEHGPYDAIHTHLQLFSGVVLRAAAKAGVRGRIAHARNSQDGQRWTPARAAYRMLMRRWIGAYATHLFAVSRAAAEGAFGKRLSGAERCRLLTGVDFSSFLAPVDRREVRRELGIADDARVIGHVGTFRKQKNHRHIVTVARHACAREPRVLFVLVGEGPMRGEIEETVKTAGLERAFRFLGDRSDVPRLLRAMDAFLFPSFYEGLPRSLLEAQVAGLPCVASDAVTAEASAGGEAVQFLSLAEKSDVWWVALEAALRAGASEERGRESRRRLEARELTIESNAKWLAEFYERIARENGS